MNKTLSLAFMAMSFGTVMAQPQRIPTMEEMMRQHKAQEEMHRKEMMQRLPKSVIDNMITAPQRHKAQAQSERIVVCDSTIYTSYTNDYSTKTDYTYDTMGNTLSETRYTMQSGVWNPGSKEIYTRDADGRLTVSTSFECRYGVWVESNKSEYAYDSEGYQTSGVTYYWTGDTWVESYKSEYTYNDNHTETVRIDYNYFDGTWKPSYKNVQTFDSNGRQTGYAYYYPSNDEWVGSYKYEYTYDNEGRQTSYAAYDSWENGNWVGNYKYEYTFDSEGRQTGSAYYYSWENGNWVGNHKYEITYNAEGKIAVETQFSWYDNAWVEAFKYEYAYDAKGNTTLQILYSKTGEGWAENTRYRYDNTYDGNDNLASSISYYSWDDILWQESSKYNYTYDSDGNRTGQINYRWSDGGWQPNWNYEYTFDSQGRQTGTTEYSWVNGAWVGSYKREFSLDDHGNYTREASYNWRNNGWVLRYLQEKTFDENNHQTGSAYYNERAISNKALTLSVDLAGDPIVDNLDEQGLLFTGSGYKVEAVYVEEPADTTKAQVTTIWENDGTHGPISWNGTYRFANEQNSSGEEIYTITMDVWQAIKEGTIRVDIAYDENEWTNIRVTTGWWTTAYGGQEHDCTDLVQIDQNGNRYLLLNIKEDGNLYDLIDQQHLLFTGSGYTVLRISTISGNMSAPTSVLWANDGTHGEIEWNGVYRFSSVENATSEEICALPMDVWQAIKEGTIRVDLECNEYSNIRITSGWWSACYGGQEHNCIDMVQTDDYGNKYLLLNIKEDGNLYDIIDQQHLLFTGSDYRLLSINLLDESASNKRYLWKNRNVNNVNFTNWDSQYLFAKEGTNAAATAIATFNAEDWELIKNGEFKLELDHEDVNYVLLRVTTGWWAGQWTGQDIMKGDSHLTGGKEYKLAGESKSTSSYDEYGNQTSYSTYRWDMNTEEWIKQSLEQNYYSDTQTAIQDVVVPFRPGIRKQLRNGQVIITDGNKTYNANGQQLK